jgi:hypothetical protein
MQETWLAIKSNFVSVYLVILNSGQRSRAPCALGFMPSGKSHCYADLFLCLYILPVHLCKLHFFLHQSRPTPTSSRYEAVWHSSLPVFLLWLVPFFKPSFVPLTLQRIEEGCKIQRNALYEEVLGYPVVCLQSCTLDAWNPPRSILMAHIGTINQFKKSQ